MPEIPSILKKILDTKAEEVAERSANLLLAEVRAMAGDQPEPRGFATRLKTVSESGPAVIAEVKKKDLVALVQDQMPALGAWPIQLRLGLDR